MDYFIYMNTMKMLSETTLRYFLVLFSDLLDVFFFFPPKPNFLDAYNYYYKNSVVLDSL